LVRLSRSANPVGTPAARPPAIAIASISSMVGCSRLFQHDVVLAGPPLGDLVDHGLRPVHDVVDLVCESVKCGRVSPVPGSALCAFGDRDGGMLGR